MRIISLVPAATEMICALGLQDQLVAVSHECDFPAEVSQLPKVTRSRLPGGLASDAIDIQVREMVAAERALYDLDIPQLAALQPDVLVTQSLCDVCAVSDRQVEQAVQSLPSRPTIVRLSPQRLGDVLEGMRVVGVACGSAITKQVVTDLQARIQQVAATARSLGSASPKVLLLEWIDPLFSAGHWNPELVELAGCQPVLGEAGLPSRRIQWSEVQAADVDAMIIACCGFSIDRAVEDMPTLVSYPGFGKLKCVAAGRVYLVNGSDYFNRPGPRLVDSLELLAHTLFPDHFELAEHIQRAARVQRAAARPE